MHDETSPDHGAVLLADDDESFRESLARLLRRQGYECCGAADAPACRRLLRERPFDVLLADIHMPGNDSLELIADLPQLAPGLPVILQTGQPAVDTAARSVRLAVMAYLPKPPDLQELFSVLRQAVAQSRRLRAVRAGRQHLQAWAADLAPIEASLASPHGLGAAESAQDYLRVTLRNLMLQLAELDRTVAVWSRFDEQAADLRQLDLIAAIRRSVEVLEKTRQNFKSKELGELRKHLQTLVSSAPAGATPATSGMVPVSPPPGGDKSDPSLASDL